MVVALVSDTHLPRGTRTLPEACRRRLAAAELIVHAGDFVRASVLAELQALGPPVVAVHGNVDEDDLRRRLPAEQTFEVAGLAVGLTHDAGPAEGRLARLRRRFPAARAVVFGHSHMPLHAEHAGFQIFNPGSPTDRRAQPRHTMGLLRPVDGRLRFELVPLD